MKQFTFYIFLSLLVSCNAGEKTKSTSINFDDKPEVQENVSTKPISEIVINHFEVDVIHGTWESIEDKELDFSLWLTVEEDTIYGQYCAMNKTATRIDCGNVDDFEECYIRGEVPKVKNEVLMEMVSCRSLKKGTVKLMFSENGEMLWSIVSAPGKYEFDYLAPDNDRLIKTSIEY